ncbi:hypothetical protein KEM52_003846, partial [Ascosphaera acerosa]
AELGMGIHNEPGSARARADGPTLIRTMLRQLLDPHDADRAYLGEWSARRDRFVLLVNNMGGVSALELAALAAETRRQLAADWAVVPARTYAGTFLTSLNGLGFSVSLLRLADTGLGEGRQLLDLLDAPAECAGWPAPVAPETWQRDDWREQADHHPCSDGSGGLEAAAPSGLRVDPAVLRRVLGGGLRRVIAAEPKVTEYDTVVGDGDCGVGLKRGAQAVQRFLASDGVSADLVRTTARVAQVVETAMDGTSGAIYAIFTNALAAALRAQDAATHGGAATIANHWAPALSAALEQLNKYTPARPGDRTLVDALAPFIDVLISSGNVHEAAREAMHKAVATKDLRPGLGRAVYVGGEADWLGKVPDPGAIGLAEFLMGISDALKG